MCHLRNVLATAAILVGSATVVHAAPQILGVVATAEPLTMQCTDTQCRVQIPTLCLEATRTPPVTGQIYRPVKTSVFTVLARNGAGQTVRVPLAHATFRAARGYTANEVTLPVSGLRARGLTPVALAMSAGTVLIPAPVPGDAHAITPAEVAHARDALWPMARQVLQQRQRKVATIGLVSRLLNQTPEAGPMAAGPRRDLWARTFGTAPGAAARAARAGPAVSALRTCQRMVAQGYIFTLRGCLETRLDSLLSDVNVAYWQDAAHGGA